MEQSQIDPHLKIVFFDGVCHLCNGFVDFAIQNGTASNPLKFAPLQGTTAAQYLSDEEQKALSSVLLWKEGQILRHSEAVLQILKYLKFPWPLIAGIARWVPKPVRDRIYHWISRNRYAWFGQKDSCRLPLPHETKQLWP